MSDVSGRRFLVIAAEPSASRAAAGVVDALGPGAGRRFFGFGCGDLAARGVDLAARAEETVSMGVGDVARKIGSWCHVWATLRRRIGLERPAAALLVDAPDLNLPMARVLRDAGIPVVQYVGPQIWAWRAGRLKTLSRRVDHVALVFEFELEAYRRAGVRASFVGHPLLDLPPPMSGEEVRSRVPVPKERPVVALLPGSRPGEVARSSPAMIEAGLRLMREGVSPVFAPAKGAASEEILLRAHGCGCRIAPEEVRARDLLAACDGAVIASGTATLEAALLGTPMVITYRMGALSWALAKRLVKVPYAGMPNILLGEPAVPELLQEEATGEALARTAMGLLEPAVAARQKRFLARASRLLGPPGAGRRVAALLEKTARAR